MFPTSALEEWIAGMVSSHLRGGTRRKSTLAEIDGAKNRLRWYGFTDAQIHAAISRGIKRSPNRDSVEAQLLRSRYLTAS